MPILPLLILHTYAFDIPMNRKTTLNAIRRSRRITASFGMVTVVV